MIEATKDTTIKVLIVNLKNINNQLHENTLPFT